jgi:hypothetical protein
MSYIRFVEREPRQDGRKTAQFDVINSRGDNLAVIGFFPKWRKFVCEAQPHTVFDADCYREIADFLEAQTVRWRMNAL